MRARRLLDLGSGTLRVTPWRGDEAIAHLTPYTRRPFTSGRLRQVLDQLRFDGFDQAVTSALSPTEQKPFLECGFSPRHQLVLLQHRLQDLESNRSVALRRGRRRDRDTALSIDAQAFTGFWTLDRTGLEDAISATPSSRFRLALDPGPVGYAVCGRAGDAGYLQRLAVDPACRRRGIGRSLVADGLGWMARRGARCGFVNTADDNQGAIDFYLRLGFEQLPDGLAVLEGQLTGAHDRT